MPDRVLRPAPAPKDEPRSKFTRGRISPRGVVWFGAGSFWGHLRHLIASAIATEDVDSRDWMSPDEPQSLVDRISRHLGGERLGRGLVENLGRELWIDYISDTGDDCAVSGAIARALFQRYELPDPEAPGEFLLAPRGDILLFGGDTAYPVATVEEINNRVVVPFNRALETNSDNKPRALLGIPGNHDWYDGLDGFARMFRRRLDDNQHFRPSMLPVYRNHYADWAKEFVLGGQVEKLKTLDLNGYTPMQRASYFALPLSEHLHLLAADRQLKYLDFRQKRFFTNWRQEHPATSWFVALPDPVFAFGKPSPSGLSMVRALELDLEHEKHLVLSGDIHHYSRQQHGESLHVIAGGGGAFLHPAPLGPGIVERPSVEWPGKRQSQALLWHAPWKIAYGRSGFLPHWACALLFAPAYLASRFAGTIGVASGVAGVALVTAAVYASIGGYRQAWKRKRVVPLALLGGLVMGLVPQGIAWALGQSANLAGVALAPAFSVSLALLVGCFVGAWCFGLQLAVFTALGLENTQAFTALDHPGFKHFLRLRVRRDGKCVDGWCIGLVDPLAEPHEPVLVDHFTWKAH